VRDKRLVLNLHGETYAQRLTPQLSDLCHFPFVTFHIISATAPIRPGIAKFFVAVGPLVALGSEG